MTERLGRGGSLIAAAAVTAAVAAVLVLGQEQTTLPPDLTDATVVATLGAASTPYPSELRAAAARAREAPNERSAAVDAARQYLDYGRSIGDARFAGAALGVLQPWTEGAPDPEVLNLAASARQYMHDFTGAIELLDRVLSEDGGNAQALLSRANIHIVQGRAAQASEDCVALARAGRPDLAILCDTTAKALTSEAPQAYERLERLVASSAIDPALHGYAASLLAEIARFQLWPERARSNFELARSESPDDLRTLMIFADFELDQGRPEAALELLKNAPPTDGVMMRQAIANKALGDAAETARLSDALRARIEAASAIGEASHAREETRFWLEVEAMPARALEAAETNWSSQRELEDALLFVAAAAAAGKPDAASPVREWARAESVVAPMYLEALKTSNERPQ